LARSSPAIDGAARAAPRRLRRSPPRPMVVPGSKLRCSRSARRSVRRWRVSRRVSMSAMATVPSRAGTRQRHRRAEVRTRIGRSLMIRPAAWTRRLDVFLVDAVVADVRIRQRDDLPAVARVGEDFLVAGERGVEHHLTDGRPARRWTSRRRSCRRRGRAARGAALGTRQAAKQRLRVRAPSSTLCARLRAIRGGIRGETVEGVSLGCGVGG
jgi:hypothetical protein